MMTGTRLERALRYLARWWRCHVVGHPVAHTGADEHPIGSMRDCPGCDVWLDDCR